MQPEEGSDLAEGVRKVREVLSAIPPEADDLQDAIVRKVAEGIVDAADLAEGERPRTSGPPR